MKLLIERYLYLLTQHAHRGVVLLVGSDNFHLTMLKELSIVNTFDNINENNHIALQNNTKLTTYIFSDSHTIKGNVTEKNFRFLLGSESQSFVYASEDIQPDMFAALAGTVVAGGLLVICWRALPNESSNVYIQRFYRQLMSHDLLLTIQQNETIDNMFQVTTELSAYSNINKVLQRLSKNNDSNDIATNFVNAVDNSNVVTINSQHYTTTQDQQKAITAINKVVTGRRKRPLMITADRGRGKTTSLALACCDLLKNSNRALRIIITAPRYTAVSGFFSILQAQLNTEQIVKSFSSNDVFMYQEHRIEFLPLDVILLTKPTADLLLVDEAAALPLHLLTQLFSFYHRIVFSSTLHGYEGAGRGFALKFTDFIHQHKMILKTIHLDTPIRWSEDDPLEALVFNTCLLNAELSILSSDTLLKLNHLVLDPLSIKKEDKPKTLIYKQYSALELLNNEGLLSKIFSVLVTAHYQTSPNDLKLLLNNEQLFIYVLQYENSAINDGLNKEYDVDIVAVAMVMNEGMLHHHTRDKALITGIAEGKRRVKNQFLPQTLLTYCGEKLAFDFSYWRIMRIAIHPQYQSKGLGTYFIQCIEQSAKENSIEILGTSFALNEQLFRFWHRVGWHIIRIGMTKDQASGERSGVLLKTLSDSKISPVPVDNNALIHRLSEQFYTSFPFYLADQFNDLSPTLVARIFESNTEAFTTELSLVELQAISDFTLGFRQYDICAYSLYKGLLWYLNKGSNTLLSESEKVLPEPLIARLLQKKSIEYVCNEYQFTGKKQLNVYFIHQFKMILKYYKEHGCN